MKKRWKKSLPDKFGYGDLRDECWDIIKNNHNTVKQNKLLDIIPYLGIFYIPTEYSDLLYCYDKPTIISGGVGLIRAKMVYLDKYDFIYYHYDDHHDQLVSFSRPGRVTLHYMDGNIIRKY